MKNQSCMPGKGSHLHQFSAAAQQARRAHASIHGCLQAHHTTRASQHITPCTAHLAALQFHAVLGALHGPELLSPQLIKACHVGRSGRQVVKSPRLATAAAAGKAAQRAAAPLAAAG